VLCAILGYMPQFVTVGHVVNKLPYNGLLSPKQLREVASCTLLAESAAKTEMQPRRLCLPLHPKLGCRHHSHSELSNLCAGSSQPPLWQVKFACIPARPTHSCRVYSGFHLLFNCVLASVFWLTFDCVICDICVCVLWQSFDCAYTT